MYLRIVSTALIFALAGCGAQRGGYSQAHVNVPAGAEGREQIYRIGKALAAFDPAIHFDEERGVANIALRRPAQSKVMSNAARRAGASVSAGLDAPSAAFLRRAQCSAQRPCDVEADTACEFTAEVSEDRYIRHFNAFADRLAYSGHAILAVLYKQDTPEKVVLRIPMYDDCASGDRQLQEAWRRAASEPAPFFARSQRKASL